ncbi:MAG: hypothetical protein HY727_19245 [Candidatus Rokubacteria bacterium]|nr:hypothetical protein [Candidatus Rokubacteria bacterium]
MRVLLRVAAVSLFMSPLLIGSSFADENTRIRTRLEPCCGTPEPDSHGRADRSVHTRDVLVLSDRLKGKVEIPIPSPGLGIATTDAAGADMRLTLSRAGVPYAECSLVLDGDEDESDEASYSIDVDLTLKNGTMVLRERKGTSDVDLATDGTQPGVPAVQDGDIATATLASVDPAIPFLEGIFATQ